MGNMNFPFPSKKMMDIGNKSSMRVQLLKLTENKLMRTRRKGKLPRLTPLVIFLLSEVQNRYHWIILALVLRGAIVLRVSILRSRRHCRTLLHTMSERNQSLFTSTDAGNVFSIHIGNNFILASALVAINLYLLVASSVQI
ncbi:uncharacterized protein G2W53_021589 [Senna tora]|uniref:Uncharacterized protein n=1 Tax=Senna tora TaxID=362788 RepID=A0A834WHD7_9FABA|nr:uncharacterized protein G2W53_021589 [Senna tora]